MEPGEKVIVGLLDSGISSQVVSSMIKGCQFVLDDHEQVKQQAISEDSFFHGATLSEIIVQHAPQVGLLNAQVFTNNKATAPIVIAAGMKWLVEAEAHIISMSFGLPTDRSVLRQANEEAWQAGVILLASAPARGASVYPASYPGVIRITGDARCQEDQISHLNTVQADFGACPQVKKMGRSTLGGASIATAHACGILANYLATSSITTAQECQNFFEKIAQYHGPEQRGDPFQSQNSNG